MIDWSKPDFVNESGVKWWVDKSTIGYAKRKGMDLAIFTVEEVDGYRTRLIVKDGNVIYMNQVLEAICLHIDMLAADKKFPK